jgi:hypothetical protein
MAGQWVAGFVAAYGATAALTAGLGLLRVALIRTGIGALVVLAGELVYQLWKVVDGADSVGDALGKLRKSGVDTLQRIGDGGRALAAVLDGVSASIVASFAGAWADILQGFIGMMNSIAGAGNPFSMAAADGWLGAKGRQTEYEALANTEFGEAAAAWSRATGDKSTATDDLGNMPGFGEIAGTLGGPGKITIPSGGGGASKGGKSEAEKAAENYADLVRGANEFIAAQELEARALGMTAEAANTMRYEQDMLNQAANDNLSLTAAQTAEMGALAQSMAAAEEATRRLTEIYDFGKDVFSGFFSDLKTGIGEGKSLWESFANAASNALDKIADKAMSMAVDGLWDMIFGAFAGGFSGTPMSLGAGGPGFLGGGESVWGPSFAGGGYTGSGARSGGLDGQGGFLAMLHPRETVTDHTKAGSHNQANDNRPTQVHVTVGVSADNNGNLMPFVQNVVRSGIGQYDRTQAPQTAVKAVQQNQQRNG